MTSLRWKMDRSPYTSLIWVFALVVGFVCAQQDCPETCVYNVGSYTVDLTPIRGSWEAVYYHGTESHSDELVPAFFNISVCQALTSPTACDGAHACYTDDATSYFSLAAHGSCLYTVEDRMVTMYFRYSSSAAVVFGSKNISVTLVCGSHLGVPEVIQGNPHDPVEIVWITSAACDASSSVAPTVSETKCYIVRQVFGSQGIGASFVDLSGLIQDDWHLANDNERPDLQLGLSVCRAMQVPASKCDDSMACLIQGDKELLVSAENLPLAKLTGNYSTYPTPHFEGDIVTVEYPIVSDKVIPNCDASPYVRIRYFCPSGDEVIGPQIEFIDAQLCIVNVVWYTMFACDVMNIQSSGCQLTTPYGISFDLTGLSQASANGSSGSSNYQYTILPCGQENLNVRCDRSEVDYSVRVIQSPIDSLSCISLGSGDGVLRYADNTLTLTFEHGDTCHNGFSRVSIITFTCPMDVENLNSVCPELDNCLTFIAEQHCSYEFEWITSAACVLETATPTCKFELNDTLYNLGLLTEDQDPTYTAVSTEQNVECYLISPCGTLTTSSDSNLETTEYCNRKVAPPECGNASICRLNSDRTVVPMGVFDFRSPSTYHTVDKNVVSVRTKPTEEGQQAVVQYVCQPGGLLTRPVFISHLTENITEFYWATFASCPQGVYVGSSCAVKEESTGYVFNLTSLENKTYVFNDTVRHYQYNIHVCDAIPASSTIGDCAAGAGMCQLSSSSTSKPHSLGRANATLVYSNSLLNLHYTSGSACSDGHKRTTTLLFYCDPDSLSASVVNVTELHHCEYLVEMKSNLACPPAFRSMECVYVDLDGNFYDLSELSRTSGNWQAEGPDGAVYIINVCRPLNLQGVGGCNPLSAVCRLGKTDGYPSFSLGYAASAYLYSQPGTGHLVLRYNSTTTGDESCPVVVTEIELVCMHDMDGEPKYIRGGSADNLCHYDFIWETAAACMVQNSTVRTSQCSVTDPSSGYTFNLLPLQANGPFNISTPNGYTYTLSICTDLKTSESSCTSSAAVCQQKGANIGVSCGNSESQTLTYTEETLVLSYVDGTPCHHDGTKRSTEIVFACDRNTLLNGHMGLPKFRAESSYCHYLFVWPTLLACLPQTLSCLAMGGKYNLRPLMEITDWIVDAGDYHYVIGVCSPVSSLQVSECPTTAGIGACKYKAGVAKSGKILGFLTGELTEVDEGHLELSYYNGDQCSSNSALRHTVHIHFYCQEGTGAGQPELINTASDDCMTQFDWNTQYACSQDQTTKNNSWVIVNPATDQVYNLTKLSSPLSATVVRGRKIYNYTVALGGRALPHYVCMEENVAICLTTSDSILPVVVARAEGTVLKIVGGEVRIDYDNGDHCLSSHNWAASVVFLYSSQEDFLEVKPTEQCRISFIVYTRVLEEEGKDIGIQCSLDNFDHLSWFSTSFLVPPISLGSLGTMYVSICSPISADNQLSSSAEYPDCIGKAGACIVLKDKSTVITGRPNSQFPPVMSDDGNGVVITYPGGDRCNDAATYNTSILLTCSDEDYGVPVLINPVIEKDKPALNSCGLIVEISSRHACPSIKPPSTASETICFIKDAFDNIDVDLSSFITDDITVFGGMYIIGVCSPVKNHQCNQGTMGTGICKQRDDGSWTPVVFGNHSLTMTSHSPHTLDIVYPTGTMTSHCELSATLRIYCSTSNSSDQPFLISDDGCELQFSWPTKNLCFKEVEGCYAIDPEDQYQFNLELLVSHLWQGVMVSQTENRVFHFNMSVCRSLNPTTSEGIQCAPGPAGICLEQVLSNTPQYLSLGYMSQRPVVTKGAIVMNYTGGSKCRNGSSTVTTTVTLMCQNKWEDELQLHMKGECLYLLDWGTPLACKQSSLESSTCMINDSQSNLQYDFKSFAKQISFNDAHHPGYNISVCLCPGKGCTTASLKNVSISNSKAVSLGNFHEMMVLPSGPPQVEFINGEACSGGVNPIMLSSVILMKCNRSEDSTMQDGFFYFEEQLSTKCRKYFSWWTPKACPTEEVQCSIYDYDFSPLSVVDGYWKVTNGDDTYLVNLCNPVHAPGTGCGSGVAVCRKNKDGTYTDLALLSTQVISFANGRPLIQFHSLLSCAQTNIIFYMTCGAQSLTLHKRSSESCQLEFDWKTTFACKQTESISRFSCEDWRTSQSATEFSFDFHYFTQQQYSTPGPKGGVYYIRICDDAPQCAVDGVSMCHIESSNTVHRLGQSTTSVFIQDGYQLQITNNADDGQVVIVIECAQGSESEKISSNELDKLYLDNVYETDGMTRAYFVIYTEKGCRFTDSPSTSSTVSTSEIPPPTIKSTSSSSRGWIVAIVIAIAVTVIFVLLLGFIFWNKHRREYVSFKVRNIFGWRANAPVRYVRVQVDEAEATLMDDFDSNESSEEDDCMEEESFSKEKLDDDGSSKMKASRSLTQQHSDEELINI